jgi:acetyl esterase/lipase
MSSNTSAPVEKLQYAEHERTELTGDFYRPAPQSTDCPIVITVHGGGWKIGSAKEFQYLGPWLASRGIAAFSIDYRLVEGKKNLYPAAVHDVGAAIQFVRSNATRLGIDPARIGLIGASAGAHLAALVALMDDRSAAHAAIAEAIGSGFNAAVRVVVAVYGPYDLLAQWEHDQATRPYDNLAENFLGVSAAEDKFGYLSASPIAYPKKSANPKPSFLLSWGTEDDIVDHTRQSKPFVTALKQSGYFVRTVPMQGAPHYWIAAPLDEEGSFSRLFAPQLLRFLRERL